MQIDEEVNLFTRNIVVLAKINNKTLCRRAFNYMLYKNSFALCKQNHTLPVQINYETLGLTLDS